MTNETFPNRSRFRFARAFGRFAEKRSFGVMKLRKFHSLGRLPFGKLLPFGNVLVGKLGLELLARQLNEGRVLNLDQKLKLRIVPVIQGSSLVLLLSGHLFPRGGSLSRNGDGYRKKTKDEGYRFHVGKHITKFGRIRICN